RTDNEAAGAESDVKITICGRFRFLAAKAVVLEVRRTLIRSTRCGHYLVPRARGRNPHARQSICRDRRYELLASRRLLRRAARGRKEGKRMAKGDLGVGTIVRMPPASARPRNGHVGDALRHVEYRIEQLVELASGTILYKVKSDAEPFDRIVEERDLAPGS